MAIKFRDTFLQDLVNELSSRNLMNKFHRNAIRQLEELQNMVSEL